MIGLAHSLLIVGAMLLPSACILMFAGWLGRRRERARLGEDRRIHVTVTRPRASLQPEGNVVPFSLRAERNKHSG